MEPIPRFSYTQYFLGAATQTKAKYHHLNQLTCKGTLRQVVIGVYRLEIHSVMLVLRTVAPLTFSLVQLSTPLPCVIKYTVLYKRIQCVRGVGVGMGYFWSPYSAGVNNLYLTRFRTYKIAAPPQTKPRRGGGIIQINTYRKVPLQINFFRLHFAL
jgi:hypothetical protein